MEESGRLVASAIVLSYILYRLGCASVPKELNILWAKPPTKAMEIFQHSVGKAPYQGYVNLHVPLIPICVCWYILSQVENGTVSRIGLYSRVVGTHPLVMVPSFHSCRFSHGVSVRFLRFRLGCHHLRVHTGRWQPVLLRPQRTCLRCSSTAVDDEAHCVFLCEHRTNC